MSSSFNERFPRWPGRVAWISLALPAIWLTAAGIPFRYAQLVNQNRWFLRELDLNTTPETAASIVVGLELFVGLALFLSGTFLIWFKGADRMGVIAAFAFLASAATIPGMTDAVIDETMTTRWLGWARFVYSLRAISATLSILLFYLLPDGRLVPRWTKYLTVVWVILNVGWLLFPQMPFSVVYGETFRATEVASIIFITIWWLTGLAAQVIRFRLTPGGVARQQLKWVAFGMGLAGLGNMSYLFIRPLHTMLGFSSDLYVLGRPAVSAVFFTCLPICITVAIFRYRLWDIDLLINRTLVYGLLSGGIIGLYSLMVGGFGFFIQGEQGQAAALVAATGLTLAVIQPLYRKTQSLANRLAPVGQPGRKPGSPDEQNVALPGRYRQLARGLYLIAAIISLGWFVVNIPFAFQQAQTAGATAQAGVPPTLYALYTVGLDALFVALCAAVSLTIFRHKSNETITLLTAGTLVVWGIFNGLIIQSNQALGAPEGMGGLLGLVGGALVFAGYMGWMLFFYLFPSGRFVPRWTRFTALAWALFSGSWILWPDSPLTPDQWPPWLFGPVVLGLWASFAAAQIVRYRRVSNPEQKQQTKWVVYGVGVVAVGFIPSVLLLGTVFEVALTDVGRHMLTQFLSIGFISLIPLTIGIAILRHQLWDIDLLINRTLVYGALTLLIVGLYALLVGGLGSLFQAQGNFAIALVTTGVIAVIFHPLREGLQRGANRLMFGQRDDPAGMLAHLARQLESAPGDNSVLAGLVETIAGALKLPYAALQVGPEIIAQFGRPIGTLKRIPLLYQHQEIGRLLVAPRSPGEKFSQADERLLATIAPLVAATLEADQLNTELRASRRAIVTGREEERRRLRRDLHDGLGPALASLALQADTARELVDGHPAETKQLLAGIMKEAQTAVADIRRLVYGLRPPALDELGLVKALRQTTRTHQMQVSIEAATPLPPLPAAVEVAAYRIAQEAINNAGRHGQARNCTVTLAVDDGLHLTITDDGTGLPPDARSGVGLISMRERVAELGGTFTIQALPAGGTQIKAQLPLT